MNLKLTKYLFLFLALLIGIQQFAIYNPLFIDKYYTNGLYQCFLITFTPFTNLVPFSVGDILYAIAIVIIIRKIIFLFRTEKNASDKLKNLGIFIVNFFLIFYLSFSILWGLNNYKTPINTQLGLKMGYEQTELIQLTNRIVKQTNSMQLQLTNDSLKPVVINKTREDILKDTPLGIQALQKQNNWFKYRGEKVKASLYSLPLTYMGFSGYLNPFTLEAQINNKVPLLTLIVTSSHEMAHQLGYAKESEANFIGFLASKKQDDLAYQYAANIYALRYCFNALSNEESAIALEEILVNLHPGVYYNLIENKLFWDNYKTITDTLFQLIYSNFLKINNQKEGLQSYSRFVDLLLQYDAQTTIYPSID